MTSGGILRQAQDDKNGLWLSWWLIVNHRGPTCCDLETGGFAAIYHQLVSDRAFGSCATSNLRRIFGWQNLVGLFQKRIEPDWAHDDAFDPGIPLKLVDPCRVLLFADINDGGSGSDAGVTVLIRFGDQFVEKFAVNLWE